MKKPFAALALAAATVAALAVPAGAAVEKNKPTYTVRCGRGQARVWLQFPPGEAATQFAVTNQCKQWLWLTWNNSSTESTGASTSTVYVQPGVRFNWTQGCTPTGCTSHAYGPMPASQNLRHGLGAPPSCVDKGTSHKVYRIESSTVTRPVIATCAH